MTTDIYKKAAQMGLLFESSKGDLTVSQLFELPLTSQRGVSLNQVALKIDGQLKSTSVSFVEDLSPVDTLLTLRMSIVKDVIATVQAANAKKRDAAAVKAQKARINELILSKKDEALSSKSLEELEAIAKAL